MSKLIHRLETVALAILWPALLLASVIYGAGITGAWLSQQMREPLPPAWGWLGAGILSLTVFGGVALGTRRRWDGWLIAVVAGLATIVMDCLYFSDGGHGLLSIPLGAFQTFVALLSGYIFAQSVTLQQQTEAQAEAEARAKLEREEQERRDAARREQERRDAERQREHDHQRELERIKLENELELQRIEARARARALSHSIPSHSSGTEQERAPIPFHPIPVERNRNGTEHAYLVEYVEQNPNATFDEITEALGIPRSTASRRLTAAGWHKNGNGWERSA